MNRRSFFTRIAKAVAIAAAAPIIVREAIEMQMPVVQHKGIYEQLAECGRVYDGTTMCNGEKLNLPELFKTLYAIKREREKNP